jgi:hypothetical protein
VNYQTVGDEFFFTLHSFLEVGKTQDLPSKFWQTLGDALIFPMFDPNLVLNVSYGQRDRPPVARVALRTCGYTCVAWNARKELCSRD